MICTRYAGGDDLFQVISLGQILQSSIYSKHLTLTDLSSKFEQDLSKIRVTDIPMDELRLRALLQSIEVLLRRIHRIDRLLITAIGVLIPDHKAMVSKDHTFVILEGSDEFREFESWSDPIDICEAITERFTGRLFAVCVIGQSADRIGVDVVDMSRRKEGMKESLDRRTT